MANVVQLEVWHNEQLDSRGVPVGPSRGYKPGDQLVAVTSVELAVPTGIVATEVAQAVFDAASGSCRLAGWMVPIALRYRMSRRRPLLVGDVVVVSGVGYVVASSGWTQIDVRLSVA